MWLVVTPCNQCCRQAGAGRRGTIPAESETIVPSLLPSEKAGVLDVKTFPSNPTVSVIDLPFGLWQLFGLCASSLLSVKWGGMSGPPESVPV